MKKQTEDQPIKLNSQLFIKTDFLDIKNEKNTKSERKSFRIPEKVKMEYKTQKSLQSNNPTFYQTNINDETLKDGGIIEPNSSVSHEQFLVFQPQSLNVLPQASFTQINDSANKLKYPFQMRLSRDEGERISDIIIEGLEKEIKVIFQVGGPIQEGGKGQIKQNGIEQQNFKQQQQNQNQKLNEKQQQDLMSRSLYVVKNQPLNLLSTAQSDGSRSSGQQLRNINEQQIIPATTRIQNQQSINISKFDEGIQINSQDQFTQKQNTLLQNEHYSFEESDLQALFGNLRSRESILRQHDFLRNCNVFSFISKNQFNLSKINGDKNQQMKREEEDFMGFLKNRLKISLFLVSLFKQRIGKIQHQALFFYNYEQMNDYLTKLCYIQKYDIETKSLFEAFLQFLWHFNSTNTSYSSQDQFCQMQTSFQRYSSIYDHFKLFIYGIKLPLPRIENYTAHRAAFDQNLPLLRKILLLNNKLKISKPNDQNNLDQNVQMKNKDLFNEENYLNIQQVDLLGLNPLQLAIQMDLRESVIVCCENGSDTRQKVFPSMLNAMEMAIAKKNESIVKQILFAQQKDKQNQWESKLKQMLQQTLETIPDFSCRMKWEQESSFLLPFIKKWTPQDTYKIFKRGKSVRIDMGLSNLEQSSSDLQNTSSKSDNKESQDELKDSFVRNSSTNSNVNQLINQKILQQKSKNVSNSQNMQNVFKNKITQTFEKQSNDEQKESKSNNKETNEKEKWNKGAWSILLKENGDLLIIDHNRLTIKNVFQDISVQKVENKSDDLIQTKKEIKPWQIKDLDVSRSKN
ncbi:hypothetical protein TTHERM_00444550 (macronuclear) [Tetrahymena thermophila SB210]|uniref:Ankyrin repeat protein n=1 Tax=Tetrahymena thermophila (strain SB210) TaxID=312017 RepID=I7MLU2_TETTS|nr:hypothetical protein TTHERM_00444550 [Tetrahymena thermophila SB210]EAS03073.2 hypothetical protein TTHERM_00444550 [Tetrahymena thermophila SB210]|eukprot:XP_001023318.2 hypothetical protein TTHERM_00444550 [Tetrahymena thermophila SB210]